MSTHINVMISSTARDLPDHRREAELGCKQLGFFPVMMEALVSSGNTAIDASLAMVDDTEIYLGIIANRYGYIPIDSRNPNELSITELEYNRAFERGIPRLIFINDKGHLFNEDQISEDATDHLEIAKRKQKLSEFKKRLQSENIITFYNSETDLRAHIVASLAQLWRRALVIIVAEIQHEAAAVDGFIATLIQRLGSNPNDIQVSAVRTASVEFSLLMPADLATQLEYTLAPQFDKLGDYSIKSAEFIFFDPEWREEQAEPRPGGTSAVFATDPDDVPRQPRRLIGREDLQQTIHPHLKNGRRVLLQGFGGMGKTALAATLAAEFIKNGSGPVLWLEIGKEQPDAIFEALARPFNAVQQIAREQGDAKIKTMRALLRQTGVKLLILDNAWDGPALKTVLEAVPNDLPVLVTSRHAFPLEVRVDVDELSDAHAVATVAYYAGDDALIHDPATQDLCELLGNLAFALEIAGKQMMADKLSPAALHQRIQAAPHDLTMPLEFSEKGRASVADLLETSIAALDEMTRGVFLAFGAFFAPQVTSLMLGLYFAGNNPIPADLLAAVRKSDRRYADAPDETLKQLLFAMQAQDFVEGIETQLTTLGQLGLVDRVDATDESVTAYRIHDLAYSYLKTQMPDAGRLAAIDACLTYTELHNEPSRENFAALQPELDNLMGAARWAYNDGSDPAVEKFAWNLYMESNFLEYRGFYKQAVTLLTDASYIAGDLWEKAAYLDSLGSVYRNLGEYGRAIECFQQALVVAQQIKDKQGEGTSLGNLGSAYYSLGEYGKAIEHYDVALRIARQIENIRDAGNWLSGLGNTYHSLGEDGKAIEHYQQSLAISQQMGDKRGEGNQLGNLGIAYGSLGKYDKAIEHHAAALVISRQIGDKRGEGSQLGNLGIAYGSLGKYDKAIEHHAAALVISQQMGDKRGEGNQLGNLGIAYRDLEEYGKAIQYLQQALNIQRQIGDKQGEGNQLANLGNIYTQLGEYSNAMAHYQQARAIFVAIGTPHLIAQTDHNITLLQAAIDGAVGDPATPPAAE